MFAALGSVASRRVLVGADVLPWRPSMGAYLLVEEGEAGVDHLIEAPGVAGVWWFSGASAAVLPGATSTADAEGVRLTICYLDADPVETAGRLEPTLRRRWRHGRVVPLLAAPFHTVIPFAWDRHLP